MGRKRRKIIKRQPKPFPSIFICPICNQQTVTVSKVNVNTAVVSCSSCGNELEVPWFRSFMPVDAYSIWYDVLTGRRSREEVARQVEALIAESAPIEGEASEVASEGGEQPVDEGKEEVG